MKSTFLNFQFHFPINLFYCCGQTISFTKISLYCDIIRTVPMGGIMQMANKINQVHILHENFFTAA